MKARKLELFVSALLIVWAMSYTASIAINYVCHLIESTGLVFGMSRH